MQFIRLIFREAVNESTNLMIIATMIFNFQDNFKINTFYVIHDSLINELIRRKTAYASINNIFKFLFTETDAHSADSFEIINNMYKTDIYIQDEWLQFNAILKDKHAEKNPQEMLVLL
ncbi:hypothetical protein ILUMI_27028 [Ignelater luminosus]|uniref:Uncharacterized protein n=1 Tax=Ignelater luminosus TaxID=2038154 RepID=A0A8K0C7B8_IGNLU|nr:hypothetical protein ILUMI_27028 [Ignelater luminosus]